MRLLILLCLFALPANAASLTPATLAAVDAAANAALAATGVPGASIAIVQNNEIIAERAYGLASLAPRRPLTPAMILPIGSVSKQFTAALVLRLAEDHKLSLDDHVARYLPDLTDAKDVTVRMLLQHLSGYQDNWPEDYATPQFGVATTPQAVAERWGRKPLDFPPGTQWQYSNTGYTIAALIAEQAGGSPFFAQLRARILDPLHLSTAVDFDAHGLPPGAPTGYETYALGAPHPGPPEGAGWSFGAGMLAMTAHDLATWDISILTRSLLKPASYDAMETDAKLANGHPSGYGLGVFVGRHGDHRFIEHSGEEIGFVSENLLYPDDHAAIAVLTNQDASGAASMIATAISRLVFNIDAAVKTDPKAAKILALCDGLSHGTLDRTQLNASANGYFTAAAIADYEASLQRLGLPLSITERVHEQRGGMTFHAYAIKFAKRTVSVTTYEQSDGKLDQFLMLP